MLHYRSEHPTTTRTLEHLIDLTNQSETPLLRAADCTLSSFVQLGPIFGVDRWLHSLGLSAHGRQRPCCCACRGRRGGDNGNSDNQQEQQMDLRLLCRRVGRV
jgi:hypothetical protein